MDIPSFELGVESAGERVTFIPRGELDLATAPELEHRVLGAVREGVLRADRVTWNGHVRDTVLFAILRDEWPV